MAHRDLGVKSSKHIPGCVTVHVTTYSEGHPCSYRWHAAKRASAETRVRYPAESVERSWNDNQKHLAKLAAWVKAGKASAVVPTEGKLGFMVAPFATHWWPWKNHAHHIIPRSVLVGVLEKLASKADPHEHRMFDVMIHGLLDEQYNVNAEPNVMILPTLDRDAVVMGLPRHLEGTGGGTADHPRYSRTVRVQVLGKLKPMYVSLAAVMKSRRHQGKDEAPAVRPVLEAISHATYEGIIAQTAAHRGRGATSITLDSIARTLYS